jgi:hypothetical protein
VLLLPLAYAIARSQERGARVLIGLIGYLFFVERGLQAAHLPGAWLRLPDFLVVMTILALTYKMGAGMVYVEEALLLSAPARAQRSRSSVRAAA